jgi:hypothetical protein
MQILKRYISQVMVNKFKLDKGYIKGFPKLSIWIRVMINDEILPFLQGKGSDLYFIIYLMCTMWV